MRTVTLIMHDVATGRGSVQTALVLADQGNLVELEVNGRRVTYGRDEVQRREACAAAVPLFEALCEQSSRRGPR